jgi:peptidoglycan hydrolase-like protein with peptidoglycan-binding domain
MTYRVINLKGDYSSREYAANTAGAAMVWHQHFNSFNDTVSYALVEIAYPVSDREMAVATEIAKGYNALIGGGLGSGDGVKVLSDGDRAEYIIDGNKEAYISEPLFVSNPLQAAWVMNPENLKAIAKVNVDVIKKYYPDGSLIALSVGHKYKVSSPNDRGAAVAGQAVMEADLNEIVINYMIEMLTDGSVVTPVPAKPTTPVPTTGRPIVKKGSTGQYVKDVQWLLNTYFGQRLTVDGIFGTATYNAVVAFQKKYGLVPDGIVGQKTWTKLLDPHLNGQVPTPTKPIPVTIKLGSSGTVVRTLQTALRSHGYSVTVDGIFGPRTKNAVIRFQKARGLAADGIVGPKTWAKLL